jgi:hypothetical protein
MSYILIDAIGVKDQFRLNKNTIADKVQHFWELAKQKALLYGEKHRYITFSDSLLVHLSEENKLHGAQLLRWIRDTMNYLRRSGLKFYAIANYGEEFKPSLLHDAIATLEDSPGQPNYIHIAGLGTDFADLFIADREIQRLRAQGNISPASNIYIHELLLPPDLQNPNEKFTINSIAGKPAHYFYFT